jgi:hypothetical protein
MKFSEIKLGAIFFVGNTAYAKLHVARNHNKHICTSCNEEMVWNATNFNNLVHFCPNNEVSKPINDYGICPEDTNDVANLHYKATTYELLRKLAAKFDSYGINTALADSDPAMSNEASVYIAATNDEYERRIITLVVCDPQDTVDVPDLLECVRYQLYYTDNQFETQYGEWPLTEAEVCDRVVDFIRDHGSIPTTAHQM